MAIQHARIDSGRFSSKLQPQFLEIDFVTDASKVSWLDDIAVLNESDSMQKPMDVGVFRTLDDLCSKLEPWFVEEQCGFALTGSGRPIELSTDGTRVFAKVVSEGQPQDAVLLAWLKEAAKALRYARIHRSQQPAGLFKPRPAIGFAERNGNLPETVEGLLAYIAMS